MVASLSRTTGREIIYNNVDPNVYRGFGFPGADEMGNIFQFKRDFEEYYYGIRDLDFAGSLNPGLQSFDQWLAKNAEKIPIN